MTNLNFVIEGQTVQVKFGSTALEIFTRVTGDLPPDVIGVMADFQLKSLRQPLLSEAELRLVRLNSSIGHKIYRRSLCFLLSKAMRELAPEIELRISHSLGGAYLFRFQSSNNDIDRDKLQDRLMAMVQEDLPIEYKVLTYAEAKKRLEALKQPDQVLLIQQKNNREVPIFECEDFCELAHFPLAHRTSVLQLFQILVDSEGLLLRFPEKTWPLNFSELNRQPILNQIFKEYRGWADIIGIPSAARLNQIAETPEIKEIIQVSETLHEKKLGSIADAIARNSEVKLVLVSGPSSAGKTTFTKKLAIHLRTVGLKPRIIGLDDYFVSREETPLDENGKPDFESLKALDIELLNLHLVKLLEGEEVAVPIFDFKLGRRKEHTRPLRLEKNEILMMEGIHGLNDELTPLVPRTNKFKIYINALTQLSIDHHFRISTTDNRLLRRLIRDYQFRGYSALHTLRMWPSVRRGEDRNIFPFQNSADAVFNSALDYELSVLKNYVVPLLKQVPPDDPQSTHSARLLDFLENFVPISSQYVPPYSILREFIGQSGFHY